MSAHIYDRHDETYQCGFDPTRHTFAQTVAHWARCMHEQCQQSNENFQECKEEWVRRFGSKTGRESLDDYPDTRARKATA